MTPSAPQPDMALRRRRYVVHLSCTHDEGSFACRYTVRIHPWAARISSRVKAHGRVFSDECELIETINPLLPRGSDVRDVLAQIEAPDGFLYLLRLSLEEAQRLGWQP